MKLTGKRILLAGIVLVAALSAYLVFGRPDNALHLDVQVSGTASTTQNATTGQATGSGTVVANAPFGNVTLSGSGSGGAQTESNCVDFDGSGVLQTAVGRLQLQLPKPGRACLTASSLGQAEGRAELQASATVDAVGMDGSLLGRHGRLKARGTFDPDTGSFTVRLTGGLRR